MLDFKKYLEYDSAGFSYLSSDQTGSETGNRLPSIDVDIKPIEKNGVVNYIKYTSNPIEIGLTDGTLLKVPYSSLRVLLGTNDILSKIKYGSNITVRFQGNNSNSRIESIKIH